MTVKEAMRASGYSQATISRLCATQKIKATKENKTWSIDPVSLGAPRPAPRPDDTPKPKGRLMKLRTTLIYADAAHAWVLEDILVRTALFFFLHRHLCIKRDGLTITLSGEVTEPFLRQCHALLEQCWKICI